MLKYKYGDIILVSSVLDPRGLNPKDRPAVVVSPAIDPSDPDAPIEVVAITTLIPDPLPDDHVLLPWQHPRHPRTGLNKRSAAVASWIAEASLSRIIRPIGFVPAREIGQLAEILVRLKGEKGSEPSSP